MKTIELKMPDDVYEKLKSLASHDHQSVNVFALRKLEEFARAFEDFRELERRAQRGSREKFQSAMAKVANVPPMPGDEL
ncbi:MAG: toxin-antitoxin system HicB family antitoxin [Verrucomicrobiota bacterium]|jgi:predicted DNA-binding protein